MRVDGSSYGSLPVPSLQQQLAQRKRGPIRVVQPESASASLDSSKQRKPAPDLVYSDQKGTQPDSSRAHPEPRAVEAFVFVGEHASRHDLQPRAARAVAAYQTLAQMPQREQLVNMFGIDTYA